MLLQPWRSVHRHDENDDAITDEGRPHDEMSQALSYANWVEVSQGRQASLRDTHLSGLCHRCPGGARFESR